MSKYSNAIAMSLNGIGNKDYAKSRYHKLAEKRQCIIITFKESLNIPALITGCTDAVKYAASTPDHVTIKEPKEGKLIEMEASDDAHHVRANCKADYFQSENGALAGYVIDLNNIEWIDGNQLAYIP